MDPLQIIVEKVVTKWLDPPRGQKIETKNLKNAHDLLIEACDNYAGPSFHPYDSSWLIVRCDLYRCIIVISLLLAVKDNSSETEAFEKVVEQSLLLLQILVGAESELELPYRTPPSQHRILNELLLEPLVPLTSDERQEFWASAISERKIDEEQIEDVTLTLPSKKELIREEQQLIKMANRPISSNHVEEFFLAKENEKEQLFLPGDILCKDGGLCLMRCGALRDQNGYISWLSNQSSISKNKSVDSAKMVLFITKDKHFEIDDERAWIEAFDLALKQVHSRHNLCKHAEKLWGK